MWARIVEILLGIWLALSPHILGHSSVDTFLWINNYICAFFICLFGLISFWYPLRKMHLVSLVIALWLWILGYRSFPDMATPLQENSVLSGLLLLMLAIIPSHSHRISHSWQEFIKKKEKDLI